MSANRALAASDAQAIADHETLHAIHEPAKMQIQILDGQNRVLDGQNQGLELLELALTGRPHNGVRWGRS